MAPPAGIISFSRAILAAACLSVASLSAADFRFAEASIDSLQAEMTAGTISSVALTQAYLGRIAEIDRAGPELHAVIELNPDALAQAQALDAERKQGKVRGPLHGLPILIKDNIATADAMETTAGSLALVGAKASRDATLVMRLRDAGAVLLGKTNLSEWANMRSSNSTSGWSGRGGQTRNPYATNRNPSGSSSGSGVAVSANLCVVAVGTETDGSIVSPASTCGIVGVKPTVGWVSRAGVIPISASQDTAGPMARSVRDAALLLNALVSRDPLDAATESQPASGPPDFAADLGGGALKGARVGVLRGPFRLRANTDAVLTNAIETLRRAGAEIVDLGIVDRFNDANDPELEVLLYEFKDGLNRYLGELREAKVRSLADVIAFNEERKSEELSLFGQDLFIKAQGKGPLTDQAYREARAKCIQVMRTDGIDALMSRHRLDTLVAITSGAAWLTDPVNGDSYTGGSSSLAGVSGYPSVTVPAGDVQGLPVGLSFIGLAWTDARQLKLAADFEHRTRARKEPRFLSNTAVEPRR